MKKKAMMGLLWLMLCLILFQPFALTETRQGVIMLEGMEEPIEETLFESPLGFFFWYANDSLEASQGEADGIKGVVVSTLYSDDYMVLSMITEEEAEKYTESIAEQQASFRVQRDVYRELKAGRYSFLTLIAENGQYLRAAGAYSQEAAEGNAKYFQRVLDSVTFTSGDDAELLKALPGEWAEEYEGAGTVLTLEENGKMSLYCYGADGGLAYTCEGAWSYEPVPGYRKQADEIYIVSAQCQRSSAYLFWGRTETVSGSKKPAETRALCILE